MARRGGDDGRIALRAVVALGVAGRDSPLKQNTGRQARVVRVVREARAWYDGRLGRMQRSDDWDPLLSDVDATVRKMPAVRRPAGALQGRTPEREGLPALPPPSYVAPGSPGRLAPG